jgi:hypothetical protein
VPVVLFIAGIAILVGVFAVATGRGGELAYEQADHAPLDLGPVSATDVALLRPPTALWGYNMQVTDEALDRIARVLRDKDIEIAYLQRQLADLRYADRPGTAASEAEAEEQNEPPRFVPRHEAPRREAEQQLESEPDNEAEAEAAPQASTETSTSTDTDVDVDAEEQGW